jgi:hypothetical protein
MKAYIIVFFEERSEGPEGHPVPSIGGPFFTASIANATMQAIYDAKLEDFEVGSVTCDCSDAGHFYIMGDDVTLHWWTAEIDLPRIPHIVGMTALREDAFGTEKHTAIQWQQGPENYHFGWIPTSLYKMLCEPTSPDESGGSSGSSPVSPS